MNDRFGGRPISGIDAWVLSEHAMEGILQRGIPFEAIERFLRIPQLRFTVRLGREVFQSLVQFDDSGRTFVLRAFVDVDRRPPEVVTVYRSSKIDKYWRREEINEDPI
jgi:hypothetical protein